MPIAEVVGKQPMITHLYPQAGYAWVVWLLSSFGGARYALGDVVSSDG